MQEKENIIKLYKKICADYGGNWDYGHCEKCPAREPCFREYTKSLGGTIMSEVKGLCPLCNHEGELIFKGDLKICRKCFDHFTEIISEITEVTEDLLKEILAS